MRNGLTENLQDGGMESRCRIGRYPSTRRLVERLDRKVNAQA